MLNTQAIASVAVIGRPQGTEFESLLGFVRHHPAVRITGEFRGIDQAIQSGLAKTIPADLVLVLQEFSDQYSPTESNELIGQMLFGRVLCCYGAWCAADGRSHDIWPVSNRVAVASASMIISMELEAFAAGRPPLSPMSAAEEVFVHRISPDHSLSHRRGMGAFIISSERPLRTVVDLFCRDFGLETQNISMSVDPVRLAIAPLTIHPEVAILDLDPPDGVLEDVLSQLNEAFPNLRVLGLTVFPHASFNVGTIHAVIDKTELQTQLHWHLTQQHL